MAGLRSLRDEESAFAALYPGRAAQNGWWRRHDMGGALETLAALVPAGAQRAQS